MVKQLNLDDAVIIVKCIKEVMATTMDLLDKVRQIDLKLKKKNSINKVTTIEIEKSYTKLLDRDVN